MAPSAEQKQQHSKKYHMWNNLFYNMNISNEKKLRKRKNVRDGNALAFLSDKLDTTKMSSVDMSKVSKEKRQNLLFHKEIVKLKKM